MADRIVKALVAVGVVGTAILGVVDLPSPAIAAGPVNIGDFVWRDLDADGVQDPGEPGVPCVTVQLWNGVGIPSTLFASTLTNANGFYNVTGSDNESAYRVRVLLPTGAAFTLPNVGNDLLDSDINPSGVNPGFTAPFTPGAATTSTITWDAGLTGSFNPPCGIGDRVWTDANANGVQDVGEPGRAGVTVGLWNAAKTVQLATAVSGPDGSYFFAQNAGSYRISADLPALTTSSPPDIGSDATDSDILVAGPDAGFTAPVSSVPSRTDVDIGIVPPARVYVPLTPARVLDSRTGGSTVDSQYAGIGLRGANSVLELPVGGRGGVPADATAVVLNVTVDGTGGDGYATMYPCGQPTPLASNLNYRAGQTVANSVAVKLGVGGAVCLTPSTSTHLLVDVAGYTPAGSPYVGLTPARLADSRPAPTVDTLFSNTGPIPAGGTLALTVVNRGGVTPTAQAVVLNVTASGPDDVGYLTLYPCGQPQPNASNVNFVAGQTVPNLVIATIGAAGQVCIFASVATDVIVDVGGYFPGGVGYVPLSPARLHDSRAGATVDGQFVNTGRLLANTIYALPVLNRGGVPADATAVVLNVTAAEPATGGYATMFPCGEPVPNASNLNFAAGQAVANAVVAKVGAGGAVCIVSNATVHFIVDVNGAVVTLP